MKKGPRGLTYGDTSMGFLLDATEVGSDVSLLEQRNILIMENAFICLINNQSIK